MIKTLFMLMFLMIISFPVSASYRCVVNSATNEVLYYATIRKDGFSKFTTLEFGKAIKSDNSYTCYIIPAFHGIGYEKHLFSDKAYIVIDEVSYEISKNTSAPHITKRHHPGKGSLLSEYYVSEEILEKIRKSKGNIAFLINVDMTNKKTMDFGLKTSDEVRFVADRSFQDYIAVYEKKLVPKYTE